MRFLSILSVLCLFILTGCEFVLSPSGPGFVDGWVVGIQVVDDTTFSAVNNGDGYADAGEEIRLNIDLQNVTGLDTTDVVATLRSLHPCASVSGAEDTVNYWTMYAGEIDTGASSFTAYLSQNCSTTTHVDFELTIETFDFFPWIEIISIPVHTLSGAIIEVEEVFLDDSTIYSSINNNDGFANPGEEIRLEVELRNTGVAAAQGVTATLVADSPCANVSGSYDTVNFWDMDPGEPKMGSSDFEVLLSLSCAPGQDVFFTLYIEDNNLGAWSQTIVLPVEESMAQLEISNVEIIEESWMSFENNGNGFPEPGEEIELQVTVTNFGTSDAQDVVGSLVTSTACASVSGSHDVVNFYDIDANEAKIGSDRFRVTLTHSCNNIAYADFTLFLEDSMGNVWEQTFSVEVN
jgi:uncharacterized repeat protein (TIGR01451 family)